MSRNHPVTRAKTLLMACTAGVALTASFAAPFAVSSAQAQGVDPNKLLEIMVSKGLVSRAEADSMLSEARAAPAPAAVVPVPMGGVAADGTHTVPYVPQVVRDQLKEELRVELGNQAQAEGWAKPGETPEWTRRISLYGDVRVRSEGRFFDKPTYNDKGEWIGGNFPEFPDWNRINRGSGYQVNEHAPNGNLRPPFLNTAEDRRFFILRGRVGLKAQITPGVSADVRVATGSDRSPVSTNQTMGADGTGKYEIWLDRASVRLTPLTDLNIDLGRFANPFDTSDLFFDGDMNFDGVAVSGKAALGDSVSFRGAAGAFPLYNTSLNFGSSEAGPYKSTDKYLLAVQGGFDFRLGQELSAKLSAGYFHFDGVEGQFSSPCYWNESVCDTDGTRPAFQQFGNTMRPLRNVILNPDNPSVSPEVQYYGLASKFQVLHLRGQMQYDFNEKLGVRGEVEFLKNLGFDRNKISPLALNNHAPIVGGQGGQFDGGDTGWQLRVVAGSMELGMTDGGW
ncbi:putative porin, partial [Sandaracinobacter sp. RS1-74]|uniref:putative porin n=1 Tax=Sandaracinobacteroides sayramensis TaxID=2913411 RepID=UPI001EDB1F0D